MRIRTFISVLVFACFSACLTQWSQNAASDDNLCHDAVPAKKPAQIKSLEKDIEQLEAKLNSKRLELAGLREAGPASSQQDSPSRKPAAAISWITGGHQGIEAGKQEGFRASDRLVVVRRDKGLRIIGFCLIEQLSDHAMTLVAEQNRGIMPEDEVYILIAATRSTALLWLI